LGCIGHDHLVCQWSYALGLRLCLRSRLKGHLAASPQGPQYLVVRLRRGGTRAWRSRSSCR
jgi:hypothetical protein